MFSAITGLVALPSNGLVRAVPIATFHTPTFVLTTSSPVSPIRSVGPLSTTVIRGFTPSYNVSVAAAFPQLQEPARAKPAIKTFSPLIMTRPHPTRRFGSGAPFPECAMRLRITPREALHVLPRPRRPGTHGVPRPT